MENTQFVSLIREFNRIHTKKFDLLKSTYLDSSYSLTEVRVLFELAQAGEKSPSGIAETLDINRGYVSRLLMRLKRDGLIKDQDSKTDGRSRTVSMTAKGFKVFKALDSKTNNQVKKVIDELPEKKKPVILNAFRTLKNELQPTSVHKNEIELRKVRAGDLGLIMSRHGAIYASEWGWGLGFEGYVAKTLASFSENYDPKNECVWIAEHNGCFIGSVAIVKADRKSAQKTAQLRWLLVEPYARGFGVGRKLVQEAVDFAKQRKYSNMILWTEQTCEAARALYRKFGFKLTESKQTKTWGTSVIEEKWQVDL